MKQIELDMIAAIRANVTDKTIGNTRVHAIIGGHEVQLHGNIIAHVDASRNAVRFTLAGWPTATMRSRINALLRVVAVGHPANVKRTAFRDASTCAMMFPCNCTSCPPMMACTRVLPMVLSVTLVRIAAIMSSSICFMV